MSKYPSRLRIIFVGYTGTFFYELGRRMLGIVPWRRSWFRPVDDPKFRSGIETPVAN